MPEPTGAGESTNSSPVSFSTTTPMLSLVGQDETQATDTEPTAEPEPALAALVNGEPVLLEHYQARVTQMEQALNRQDPGNGSNQTVMSELRQQVLEGLIEQKVIEQQADALGISVSQETVEAEAQRFIAEFEPRTRFDTWLADNGLTDVMFLTDLRSQLIANQVFEAVTHHVVAETIEATRQQKQAAFDDWLAKKRAEAEVETYVNP
ncbi:MAG: SurA N-terminal domain-containing protein [Anaerolineae bacterium]|nr:SurA N-terminal domain-containing protein [Anaerolineae bacterium]